jgi:hypothetical protein
LPDAPVEAHRLHNGNRVRLRLLLPSLPETPPKKQPKRKTGRLRRKTGRRGSENKTETPRRACEQLKRKIKLQKKPLKSLK